MVVSNTILLKLKRYSHILYTLIVVYSYARDYDKTTSGNRVLYVKLWKPEFSLRPWLSQSTLL